LILGALLAFMIVFLFIRNVRNTIITVAGLPVIVMGTFAVISLLGYTLNIITLMALSLSIGLLIDDAIVVRENIFRHMEHGATPKEAADKATGEIAFAVIAISLTVVAVFIPVAFTSGQIPSVDPIAKALLALMPPPDNAGDGSNSDSNNYTKQAVQNDKFAGSTLRIDQSWNESNHTYVNLRRNDWTELSYDNFGPSNANGLLLQGISGALQQGNHHRPLCHFDAAVVGRSALQPNPVRRLQL